MEPEDPASTPSDAETSQMPAVPPAKLEPEPVIWPEDPWVADRRAADDSALENGPIVTSAVVPTWPENPAGKPSVPSHEGRNPTHEDPITAPFPTRSTTQPMEAAVVKTKPPEPAPATEPEAASEVNETVPPSPAAEEDVETKDAALESLPPELTEVEAADDAAGAAGEEAVIEAVAEEKQEQEEEEEEPQPAAAASEEADAEEGTQPAVAEEEPELEPAAAAAAEVPAAEAEAAVPEAAEPAAAEPEAAEPEPAAEPESEKAAEPAPEPELEPVRPSTPTPVSTPAWAAQAAPATPAPPVPAEPSVPANPVIPSWAPNAPPAAAKPEPEQETQWPGINVPAWAPQPTASHPGTANPLPSAGGPYTDPVREPQPAPPPAPAPAPKASTSTPAPAPTAPTMPAAAPSSASSSTPPPKTSSWEVVEQKHDAEPKRQGPSAEDKSYAEWFAWAKRSGAPASACHAAAQGAFRALAAGHDMNTAVQWATLAMASPPGLVGQSRQIYCAWYSLGNIDLKLPTAQAHAFANGAIQALEEGADSMSAHQAGLLAAGITGG